MEDRSFDKLERVAYSIFTKQKYVEQNRTGLLYIHTIIGVAVGLCIFVWGGPTIFGEYVAQDFPNYFGFISLLGGFILFVGIRRGRDLYWESGGMLILLVFYAFFFIGFIVAWFTEVSATTPYPIPMYGGLAAMMVVHLRTVYQYMQINLDYL